MILETKRLIQVRYIRSLLLCLFLFFHLFEPGYIQELREYFNLILDASSDLLGPSLGMSHVFFPLPLAQSLNLVIPRHHLVEFRELSIDLPGRPDYLLDAPLLGSNREPLRLIEPPLTPLDECALALLDLVHVRQEHLGEMLLHLRLEGLQEGDGMGKVGFDKVSELKLFGLDCLLDLGWVLRTVIFLGKQRTHTLKILVLSNDLSQIVFELDCVMGLMQ